MSYRKIKKIWRLVSIEIIFTLFVLLCWVWFLYMTQPATKTNTYASSEKIVSVKIQLAHHRGSDKLYITTKNNRYMLDTEWRNENKSNKLANDILFSDQNYSIIVWKHIPKSLFHISGKDLYVYQIVDLRNNDNIYFSIESHNGFQKSERLSGIILCIIFSVIAIAIDCFAFPMICSIKHQSGDG